MKRFHLSAAAVAGGYQRQAFGDRPRRGLRFLSPVNDGDGDFSQRSMSFCSIAVVIVDAYGLWPCPVERRSSWIRLFTHVCLFAADANDLIEEGGYDDRVL